MKEDRRQQEVSSGTYKQGTEVRLVIGGFVLLTIVGGILMTLLLGSGPAALGTAVIVTIGVVLLALYQGLAFIESWLKRGD